LTTHNMKNTVREYSLPHIATYKLVSKKLIVWGT